jgi:hypothetical protein
MWWAAWGVAAIVAAIHFFVAGRYDVFRNELYFIVCGRHPSLGYVDQPPLVPLLAAATQLGGTHVWLLRVPAVLAAALLIPLTVDFARIMGATTRGAWLAAIAAASAPMLVGVTSTFTTSTFEPLAWTALAYLLTRALVEKRLALLTWAGAVFGIAFEAKYGIAIWAFGLAAGIAATQDRTILRARELWIGAGIAALLAAPNVAWQLVAGLPFLEVMRNENAGNLTGSPVAFAIEQAFALNIVAAPIWVTGIVAPLASSTFARYRFLAIAFIVTACLVWLTHGKSYYLAGAYPSLFALGAAAWTRLPSAFVGAWAALTAINAVLALPLVLPVLPPAKLARFIAQMPVKPRPVEVAGIDAPLTQVFSDEFGWRDLARTVEDVYASLPPQDRSQAAILASNYGEAAAIDFYGKNLPPALSEQNQYYLWGPRKYDGSLVIAVNANPNLWSRFCASERVVATFGSRYAIPYERNRPIVLCRELRVPLQVAWPRFRRYGL